MDQWLKIFYHTFKHLLEFHCLPVCLCPAFWVVKGSEIEMFASLYIQRTGGKGNQLITGSRSETDARGQRAINSTGRRSHLVLDAEGIRPEYR